MLADCLTKSSAPPDALIKAVNTGILPDTDVHPPFRELMLNKHKAFWIRWIAQNIRDAQSVQTFLGVDVTVDIGVYFARRRP